MYDTYTGIGTKIWEKERERLLLKFAPLTLSLYRLTRPLRDNHHGAIVGQEAKKQNTFEHVSLETCPSKNSKPLKSGSKIGFTLKQW